jgi:hypothetical protein
MHPTGTWMWLRKGEISAQSLHDAPYGHLDVAAQGRLFNVVSPR